MGGEGGGGRLGVPSIGGGEAHGGGLGIPILGGLGVSPVMVGWGGHPNIGGGRGYMGVWAF